MESLELIRLRAQPPDIKDQCGLERGGVTMWVLGLFLLTAGVTSALIRLDPLVDALAGLIRGVRADDGDYSLFMGIPYAQVDKDNPFGASTPQPKFDTIFDAATDAEVCPQVEEYGNTIVGSLDCLQLNVYVPNKASSRNRLPVLVWIHGGGFTIGYTSRTIYGPKYLVRNDIILVAVNYRVGPYGFFCLDTPEIPGNQGLKDQVLALRWVRDNIAAFGGDVDKITVMGESAGAASIEYHLLSKHERLFNQAITQSGTTFLPGLFEDDGRSKPLRIAAQLGFETEDLEEAIAFLAKTDVKLVIAATTELGIGGRPCIEKEFENVDSILTDNPINLDMPKARNINVLAGFNNKEQLMAYVAMPADQFKNLNVFEEALEKRFTYDEELKEMEGIVRRFYIGDEELSDALRDQLIDFQSDYSFAFPIQQSLNRYLGNGARNVYYYMFSYSGDRNFVKKRANVTAEGAAHADELGYLYDLTYETETTEADQLVIDRITTLWANFVKYGDPTPATSELLPVKWTPITEDNFTFLNIDSDLTLGSRPYNDRMAFWELFFLVNQDKLKGYREN